MKIQQLYTKCLAQGAYYIENNGEAAVIDPLREVQQYIDLAIESGAKIKYIFETHFHADFVSGHVTLAEKTGATIVYGPTAQTIFKTHIATDGEEFSIGNITIKALHTPGHTMESTTYLLINEEGENEAIFTGDTLFLGDVGRPDLAQKSDITQSDLAGMLYDSLRSKIMPLADSVTVYPAHGAGSACGKNMMQETVDTLGNQKKMNYALRADMTKEEFINEVTDGLLPPPAYFPHNVQLNKQGYESIETVFKNGTKALSVEEFVKIAEDNKALILDVRPQSDFFQGHIPNSLFIGLNGSFAPWVGELIVDTKTAILLVCPDGKEKEAVTRLARVGFDNTLGFLEGGIQTWQANNRNVATLQSISADILLEKYEEVNSSIFDVRKPGEYEVSHIAKAIHSPLSHLKNDLEKYRDNKETSYIHCAGGYRSVIACSILKANGIHNVVDISGGYHEIKKTDIPRTEFVCPSTLK